MRTWQLLKKEIDFCGHATLATAFVLFNYFDQDADTLNLYGQIGEFTIHKSDDMIKMEFPDYKLEHIEITDTMIEALGTIPLAVYKDRDILFVLRDEDEVRYLQPDMELISKLDGACVDVTAKGTEYDCVSRVLHQSMVWLKIRLPVQRIVWLLHIGAWDWINLT